VLATPLVVANRDHKRSGEDAHDLVCVMAMKPTALARTHTLANDYQLAQAIRWPRDHTFGALCGALVHKRHGSSVPE
jgi:hypothetical protein